MDNGNEPAGPVRATLYNITIQEKVSLQNTGLIT
jgi:hypothetical protein